MPGCQCFFFFPSLYEGFGLPVLDALACGLPVVVSSSSSLPEVGGEHAIYCEPLDVADMVRALNQAWDRRDPNDPRRFAAVRHARNFRWEKLRTSICKALRKRFFLTLANKLQKNTSHA
ncbi:MAG: glycosyltransferase [Candidatus Competibacteraceae bacterium]|nr:glycosyltransferase [Candidatus Competibacteraceae bacterium]